ncbi:MAG: hypothetical protein ACO3JL_14765, partial [Myxococcota bacterium]
GYTAWRRYEAHAAPLATLPLATAAPPPPALPAQVRVSFTSIPPGAEVRLAGHERPLGTTPFAVDLPPPRAAHDFVFALAGFRERTERLSPPRADVEVSAALEELPSEPAPAPEATPPPASTPAVAP